MDRKRAVRSGELSLAGLILTVLARAAASFAQGPAAGYWDTFDYPDGAFPDEWGWTGYSEEGGHFLVYDGAFTHVEGGAAYYYRMSGWANRNLPASYDFLVEDSPWVFAWRITSTDPSAGRCLWLSHDDSGGYWAYTFAECSWENLDPGAYPEGEFMWHNATMLRSVQQPTAGPLVGWHMIHVWEYGPQALDVEVWVDTDLIFDESYEYIPEGHQGLGCPSGGDMSPAFDSLWAQWPDPVESGSWGRIKSLYR